MDEFVLYVIVRNDLDSLTPGKAAAQACHAANQCVETLKKGTRGIVKINEWLNQADKFGTTIVLQASMKEIYSLREFLYTYTTIPCGIVHDPTYPIQDGEITHLIPLDTCMWIFGTKEELAQTLGHLELL